MTGFISRDECAEVVLALKGALDSIPENAAALRSTLKTQAREYNNALKLFDRAVEDCEAAGLEEPGVEIRALGSLAGGEVIQLARPQLVRRTSDNGVCIFDQGKESWLNYAGKTTPLVVLKNVEADR